jgi:hypothetical protein
MGMVAHEIQYKYMNRIAGGVFQTARETTVPNFTSCNYNLPLLHALEDGMGGIIIL